MAKVETGMVMRRPMPIMRRPMRFKRPIASQKRRSFQKLPRVMAKLSFMEAMGPILVSTRMSGENENRTAQIIPGTINKIRPAKTTKGKSKETAKNFQNNRYSENMSANFGFSPSD